MRWLIILLVGFFMALKGLAQPAGERPSNPLRLTGRVVDSVTGEGLAGVNVLVLSLRDSTRSWGSAPI